MRCVLEEYIINRTKILIDGIKSMWGVIMIHRGKAEEIGSLNFKILGLQCVSRQTA